MYASHGFNNWGIGDVEIIKVGGTYHLFHLVLPNHSYIAHAVSYDGIHWRRVKNALFIGEPGAWDDNMLWTMHVSEDPDKAGAYRMFYTGLTSGEWGRVQRVGLAVSDNLFDWHKVNSGKYPLSISKEHYESRLDVGRHWVSFRDPFFYRDDGRRWLLAAGRVKHGPVVHRGCVALAEEVARDRFEFKAPLYFPGRYDDIETPSLVKIKDMYYLIGSIREDVKVHYWWAERPEGPYRNFSDNVLLPKGNYAARVCRDNGRVLLWHFFSPLYVQKGQSNLLPPPKELVVNAKGELQLKSFYRFDDFVAGRINWQQLRPITPIKGRPSATNASDHSVGRLGTRSGMEVFCFNGEYTNFRLRGDLTLEDSGKCGWVFHVDEQASGYYVSIDPFKGLAQIRAWGHRPGGVLEDAYIYETLQAAYFIPSGKWPIAFELLAFGKYMELTVDGQVVLSLADEHYVSGRVGFYTEGGHILLENCYLEEFNPPRHEEFDPITLAQVHDMEE